MNEAGYDAMCIGNHELDWGYDNLKSIVANTDFPILTANLIDRTTGQPAFQERQVFTTRHGLKIGIFGLSTPRDRYQRESVRNPESAVSGRPGAL